MPVVWGYAEGFTGLLAGSIGAVEGKCTYGAYGISIYRGCGF